MAKHIIVLLLVVISTLLQSNAHSNSHSHESLENLVGVEKGMTVKGVHRLKQYLQKYGYLSHEENHANNDEFDDRVESAIKRYQEFFSLNPTGKLDSDTIIEMAKPRCGFPDIIHNNSRMQQVSLQSTWPPNKMSLTYIINNTIEIFNPELFNLLVSINFGKWSAASNFKFKQVLIDDPRDLSIGFRRRSEANFPINSFAFANLPPGGICCIDAATSWSITKPDEHHFDLDSVVLHEMGHLLGLLHSNVREAVMWAYFDLGETRRELTQDDVRAIHQLYGISPAAKK